MARKLSIVDEVQKLVRDRSHLRTVISSMITIARDMPGAIKPAIIEQLKAALEYTKGDDDV
jgi:hypothetical protein